MKIPPLLVMNQKQAFKLLGIEPTLDVSLIKVAFRKKALQTHPDVNNDPYANENFRELSHAYEIACNGDQYQFSYEDLHRLRSLILEALKVERILLHRQSFRYHKPTIWHRVKQLFR